MALPSSLYFPIRGPRLRSTPNANQPAIVCTTPAAATAGHVKEDDVTYVGVGYNMGGGVNSFIQFNNMSYTDGNHATVTDTDPNTLSMGITLGF